MMEWIRLECGNDWGTEFVMLPGGSRGDRKNAINVPEDSKLRVVWENEDGDIYKSLVPFADIFGDKDE